MKGNVWLSDGEIVQFTYKSLISTGILLTFESIGMFTGLQFNIVVSSKIFKVYFL